MEDPPYRYLFLLVFHKKYSTFVCKSTENLESLSNLPKRAILIIQIAFSS
jgi:hypothetical protein